MQYFDCCGEMRRLIAEDYSVAKPRMYIHGYANSSDSKVGKLVSLAVSKGNLERNDVELLERAWKEI